MKKPKYTLAQRLAAMTPSRRQNNISAIGHGRVTICLTQNKTTHMSPEDFIRARRYSWFAARCKRSGYWRVQHTVTMPDGCQRAVLLAQFLTGKLDVDHKDRNTFNNLRSNLRIATRQQQAYNRKSSSKTGFRGVIKTSSGRFAAQVRLPAGYTKHVGTFDTLIEAAIARDRAALVAHKEFATLNILEHPHTESPQRLAA